MAEWEGVMAEWEGFMAEWEEREAVILWIML